MEIDSKLIAIILAVLLDGAAGLAGGFLPTGFIQKHRYTILSFAAGTLVGACFFDLLPNALTSTIAPHQISYFCLAGFVLFFILESLLGSHAAGQSGHQHDTIGPMILVGDALHNIADGAAIASAFLANSKIGIATTFAVIVHELPQEISDFTILVSHGYSRGKAILYLTLVQFSAFIGAFLALFASTSLNTSVPYLMAVCAGGFLYIACANLLPELNRKSVALSKKRKLFMFSLGVLCIGAIEMFL